MNTEPLLILLVEDNLDHAELIKRTLADQHIASRVHHLTDGQTAIEYLSRSGGVCAEDEYPQPYVVLLDLRLPRVDGIEVLKYIKESDTLKHIPVVILTTSHAERDITRAYANYANSYLVKPVGYEAFRTLMEDLGVYWLRWNTSPRIP
jgi:CheY-like chemotaxis protein